MWMLGMRCIYQCHKRHYQYTCLIAYAIFLQEVLLSIKHFELSQYTGAFLNYLKYKCIKKKKINIIQANY